MRSDSRQDALWEADLIEWEARKNAFEFLSIFRCDTSNALLCKPENITIDGINQMGHHATLNDFLGFLYRGVCKN